VGDDHSLIGLFLGFAIAGFLVYDGLKTVVNHVYCPVLNGTSQGLQFEGLDQRSRSWWIWVCSIRQPF
jgi:hypothetical protein